MRILLIATTVGKNAPGIVYERLIEQLSLRHEIHLITSEYAPSKELSSVKRLTVLKRLRIHPKINKAIIALMGFSLYDFYWAKRNVKNVSMHRPDIVLSFISFHNYGPLELGRMVANSTGKKFAIYSVDAIPAPRGWPEQFGYYEGVQRMMRKFISAADAFFSSNEKMLHFQLATLKSQELPSVVGYILTPSSGVTLKLPMVTSESYNFVYTGGIYGARKVNYLLIAFEKLLSLYPNSFLIFVGTIIDKKALNLISEAARSKIKILSFSKDLNHYYSIATALIDIDADIEDDVFLSSKIVNYINVNRVIISETGQNSPSRKIFKGINSIIQCDHNSDELYLAMTNSIEGQGKFDFSDRKGVINQFDQITVVSKLEKDLKKLGILS